MLRTASALLGYLLLFAATARAETPTAEPADAPPAAAAADETARPPLPERSESETWVLEQRLDQREQQHLQAGGESVLALWRPANTGAPDGVVILLPGDVENADGAQLIGPLRRKLPDAGWHSLSLTLPDPDGDPLPLRQATAPEQSAPAEQAAGTTEARDTGSGDDVPPTADAAPIDPAQRRDAHAQRVQARIAAAIAFARQRHSGNIVLLGHGSGAYWAARYIGEQQDTDLNHLLMVAPALPAGFGPTLDELAAPLAVAVGDFYYADQPAAREDARKRLQASKRAKAPDYSQTAVQALPGNPAVEQEQLYRRLRGWLIQHATPGQGESD